MRWVIGLALALSACSGGAELQIRSESVAHYQVTAEARYENARGQAQASVASVPFLLGTSAMGMKVLQYADEPGALAVPLPDGTFVYVRDALTREADYPQPRLRPLLASAARDPAWIAAPPLSRFRVRVTPSLQRSDPLVGGGADAVQGRAMAALDARNPWTGEYAALTLVRMTRRDVVDAVRNAPDLQRGARCAVLTPNAQYAFTEARGTDAVGLAAACMARQSYAERDALYHFRPEEPDECRQFAPNLTPIAPAGGAAPRDVGPVFVPMSRLAYANLGPIAACAEVMPETQIHAHAHELQSPIFLVGDALYSVAMLPLYLADNAAAVERDQTHQDDRARETPF